MSSATSVSSNGPPSEVGCRTSSFFSRDIRDGVCYHPPCRTAQGLTSLPRFPAGSHRPQVRSGKRSDKTKELDLHRKSIRSREIWTISTGRLVARLRRKARLSSDSQFRPSRASRENHQRGFLLSQGLLIKPGTRGQAHEFGSVSNLRSSARRRF